MNNLAVIESQMQNKVITRLSHSTSYSLGLLVLDFGFRASGFWLQASGFGLRAFGLGFRVSGFGLRASGLGFRASDIFRAPES